MHYYYYYWAEPAKRRPLSGTLRRRLIKTKSYLVVFWESLGSRRVKHLTAREELQTHRVSRLRLCSLIILVLVKDNRTLGVLRNHHHHFAFSAWDPECHRNAFNIQSFTFDELDYISFDRSNTSPIVGCRFLKIKQLPAERYTLKRGSRRELWDSVTRQELGNLLEPEENIGNS